MDNIEIHETIMGILGIGISYLVLLLIYRALRMRNKERLALIERNMDPSLGKTNFTITKNDLRKAGWILVAIALGVVSGYLGNLRLGIPDFVSYATMILFCCGIVLLYLFRTDKY